MIDVKCLVKDTNNIAYINSLNKRYNEFISTSDIPFTYLKHNIDVNKLSSKYKKLNDNIYKIVSNRYNYIFNVKNYDYDGYLASLLLDSYFIDSIAEDNLTENIVYVDTNLLLDDYKKLMDYSSDYTQLSLSHNVETLTRYVETAACVIWDRFSLVTSNYDKQKLYNLVLTRFRRHLGNLFFITDAEKVLANTFSIDMYQAMNISQNVDCREQNIKFKPTKNVGGEIW